MPACQRIVHVGGHEIPVFTMAAIAKVLQRSRRTLLMWERAGFIPRPFLLGPEKKRTETIKGSIRYYLYEEIQEIAECAIKHGLTKKHTPGTLSEAFREEVHRRIGAVRRAFRNKYLPDGGKHGEESIEEVNESGGKGRVEKEPS